MIHSIAAFVEYLATSVVLLLLFVYVYARATPYKEFALIAHDNIAVAITFAGAVIGFTFPMLAAIFYTHSLVEMIVWAAITCVVQLGVLLALRGQAKRIEEGHVCSAIMVATFSVSIGLLNAVSISN
jgi:putative membrane protein